MLSLFVVCLCMSSMFFMVGKESLSGITEALFFMQRILNGYFPETGKITSLGHGSSGNRAFFIFQ